VTAPWLRRALAAVAAAVLLGALVGAPARAADPDANRKASAAYDTLVGDNPAFRAQREAAECGAIESLDLRAQCVASFERPTVILPPVPEPPAPVDFLHPRVTVTNGPVRNPDDD
jgi:hypothetical protein